METNKVISDYEIAENGDVKKLNEIVKEMIKNGWQPYGKLVVVSFQISARFCQPMVKYESPEQPTKN